MCFGEVRAGNYRRSSADDREFPESSTKPVQHHGLTGQELQCGEFRDFAARHRSWQSRPGNYHGSSTCGDAGEFRAASSVELGCAISVGSTQLQSKRFMSSLSDLEIQPISSVKNVSLQT